MMKKIAIITFSRAHNYGSILQGYALQKYLLKNFDCECDIIDFSNKNQCEMYKVFKKNNNIRNIVKNILALFFYKKLKREYDDFEKFINENLILSKDKFFDSNQLKALDGKYDIYIAGSDQVWNITCMDADDAYFLNFVTNGKKIAYAPSFGARNILNYSKTPEKYANYIKNFDYVSIREINGKKWIKDLTGLDVPILIDPTMFYDMEEWKKIMSPSFIKEKYILYYAFHFSQEVNKKVKELSKKFGLPVYILSSHGWVYNLCALYGFKLAKHSGPSEFIRLINDAEIVFSTSFHGTVFATLFHKNFWFMYGSIQDATDDRALTLVKQMGIEDRVIKMDELNSIDFSKVPDYSIVDKKLESLRKEAFNYLNSSIGEK